jgi:hypothetical protein
LLLEISATNVGVASTGLTVTSWMVLSNPTAEMVILYSPACALPNNIL